MENFQQTEKCPICERDTPQEYVEKHHTVPKSKKGKETEQVCCNCGDMIHQLIPLNELKKKYNTIALLKSHSGIQQWIKWISKKPNDFSVCMKLKKRRK